MLYDVSVAEEKSARLGVDARSLSTLGRTGCRRYAAMISAGADVSILLAGTGFVATLGETESAYVFGRRFEEGLLAGSPPKIVRVLEQYGFCGRSPVFVNLLGRPSTADRAASLAATVALVARRRLDASGDLVVVGSVLPMPGLANTCVLLPDVLLFRDGSCVPVPVEVKVYEDRGPLTSRDGLDGAVAQCGLYAVAFEDCPDLGFGRGGLSDEGVVVLREAGRRRGRAIAVDVSRAREAARSALSSLPTSVADFASEFGVSASRLAFDLPSVTSVPCSYGEACASSCGMYELCRSESSASCCSLGDALASYGADSSVEDLRSMVLSAGSSSRGLPTRVRPLVFGTDELRRLGIVPVV